MLRKSTSLECSGKIFFVKMKLGTDFDASFVTVPIEALVYPLCVIPDIRGGSDIYTSSLGSESLSLNSE